MILFYSLFLLLLLFLAFLILFLFLLILLFYFFISSSINPFLIISLIFLFLFCLLCFQAVLILSFFQFSLLGLTFLYAVKKNITIIIIIGPVLSIIHYQFFLFVRSSDQHYNFSHYHLKLCLYFWLLNLLLIEMIEIKQYDYKYL